MCGMEALPIFMKLRGRRCVVIGGGEVAARKVVMLLKADAEVEVVAPELHAELAALTAAGSIRYLPSVFIPWQLDGACLVIAATDDESVNRDVSRPTTKASTGTFPHKRRRAAFRSMWSMRRHSALLPCLPSSIARRW